MAMQSIRIDTGPDMNTADTNANTISDECARRRTPNKLPNGNDPLTNHTSGFVVPLWSR
jgi:hypothetical protein